MNKTINVPDSWSEVTVTQFQELEATENIVEKIAILANEDPEYIRKMDIESFKRVSKALEWVHTMPDEKEGSEVLTFDDTKYYLIPMSSLSLGSWMDIEHYMQEPIQNIHKLMAIFYRESPNAEYNSITGAKRAELFLERMSVNDCYGTLVFFSLIEKKVLNNYKGLFSDASVNDGGEAGVETEAERIEREAEEKKAIKWSWFSFAYHLAKGDVTKMEAVMSLNFVFVLNFKSFEVENKNVFEYYDHNRYNIRQ